MGGDARASTHLFTVIGHNSYATQWGGETININNTTVIPFFSGTELGPTNSITFDDGYYYSFRLLDFAGQAHANMEMAVLRTAHRRFLSPGAAKRPPYRPPRNP